MAKTRTSPISELPQGFTYQPEFLTEEEESELLRNFGGMAFAPVDFHGFTAKRRVIEFGWEYDFGTRKATETVDIPEFLMPIRDRAAAFAGVASDALVEGIIIEYSPGAPIGWHRDVAHFDVVVGLSLASSCRMRLKPYRAEGNLVSVILEPRSIYAMQGVARWQYQHSIPPVEQLRYSITFRTLGPGTAKRVA